METMDKVMLKICNFLLRLLVGLAYLGIWLDVWSSIKIYGEWPPPKGCA